MTMHSNVQIDCKLCAALEQSELHHLSWAAYAKYQDIYHNKGHIPTKPVFEVSD